MITEGFSGLGEKATCVAVSVTMASVSVLAPVSGRGVAIGNLICELVDSVELTPLSVCVELDSLLSMGGFSLPDLAADFVRFFFRSSIAFFTIPIDR